MLIVFIRVLLVYSLIIASLRLMGKRQLGELQPSELVVTILVSNIATMSIEDTNVPLLGGIIPILSLVCFDVIVSAITLKFKTARRIISGSPRIIIRDGVIDQEELHELRFTIDDMMEQLRGSNIFDLRDVAFAIVETTGQLSVYQKYSARNVTADMIGIKDDPKENDPPVVIISDGMVSHSALSHCKLSHDWLEQTLSENGYKTDDIFIMTCNRNADYYIVPAERKNKKNKKHKEGGK